MSTALSLAEGVEAKGASYQCHTEARRPHSAP